MAASLNSSPAQPSPDQTTTSVAFTESPQAAMGPWRVNHQQSRFNRRYHPLGSVPTVLELRRQWELQQAYAQVSMTHQNQQADSAAVSPTQMSWQVAPTSTLTANTDPMDKDPNEIKEASNHQPTTTSTANPDPIDIAFNETKEEKSDRIKKNCKAFRAQYLKDWESLEAQKKDENYKNTFYQIARHYIDAHKGIASLATIGVEFLIKKLRREDFDPQELHKLLLKLGVVGIKLAQNFYMIQGLPDDYKNALKPLLDKVEPVDFHTMKAHLCTQLEAKGQSFDDIFEPGSMEPTPVGCGSVAQVYKARLKDSGKTVAVKIVKPNTYDDFKKINKVIEAIFELLELFPPKGFAPFVSRRVSDYLDAYLRECDLEYEQFFMEKFLEASQACELEVKIRMPTVHKDLSGKQHMVMDFIEGGHLLKIAEQEPVRALRMYLNAGTSWFRVASLTGFIHTDMHHGNFMGCSDDPDAVHLIDWGRAALAPDFLLGMMATGQLVDERMLEKEDRNNILVKTRNTIREVLATAVNKHQEQVPQQFIEDVIKEIEPKLAYMDKGENVTGKAKENKESLYMFTALLQAQLLMEDKNHYTVSPACMMMVQNFMLLLGGAENLERDPRITDEDKSRAYQECLNTHLEEVLSHFQRPAS